MTEKCNAIELQEKRPESKAYHLVNSAFIFAFKKRIPHKKRGREMNAIDCSKFAEMRNRKYDCPRPLGALQVGIGIQPAKRWFLYAHELCGCHAKYAEMTRTRSADYYTDSDRTAKIKMSIQVHTKLSP
jgi:hypothetical protein